MLPMPNEIAATERQYARRDTEALSEHYLRHVEAMTTEGLDRKSDIAAELAWRDECIDREKAKAAAYRELLDRFRPEYAPSEIALDAAIEAIEKGTT